MKDKQETKTLSKQEINKIFVKNENNGIISATTEQTVNIIMEKEIGRKIILSIIEERILEKNKFPSILDGFVYQKIIESEYSSLKNQLSSILPHGVLKLKNSMELDYQPLQNFLINKEFQKADKLTQDYLCQIVEKKKNQRKSWLYFTDIQFIPKNDLLIIDLLWKIYSKGKFGFSVQKKIWITNNKKWDTLWKKINWFELNNGIMKRYPQEFLWTLEAPEGHLPLFNQLRGTQSLAYIFKSIDW